MGLEIVDTVYTSDGLPVGKRKLIPQNFDSEAFHLISLTNQVMNMIILKQFPTNTMFQTPYGIIRVV
jgi:hypothetical protein